MDGLVPCASKSSDEEFSVFIVVGEASFRFIGVGRVSCFLSRCCAVAMNGSAALLVMSRDCSVLSDAAMGLSVW